MDTPRLPTGAKFDKARADRAVDFVHRHTVHTKSRWARRPFILGDWQNADIVRPVFGTVRYDDQWESWVRQYVVAWIELARKNGKSELAAALGLYLLIADGEESGEIYGCASDRDQARAVYDVAKRMCELSPVLAGWIEQKKLEVIDSRHRIIWHPTNSVYQVVAADAAGNLGSNPSGVLFDEVLTQPSRELWDAFLTGEGTREQMLMIALTTAGNDPTSFCYAEHEFGLKVMESADVDPTRYAYIRSVGMDDDWTSEANWYNANPALGDFLNINTLRAAYKRAVERGDLTELAAFRQFRCNQWQRQVNRWLDMTVWDANLEVSGEFDEDACESLPGWGGFDLAETDDFTAWVMIFEDEDFLRVIPRFWIPRKAIDKKHKRIKSFIESWEAQGFLRVTDGEVVDFEVIKTDILADLERFGVTEIGYDQYQAPAIVQAIEAATDVECFKVPQTTLRLNAPSKELTRLLGMRALAHNGNPILRWMADNVEAQSDADGNIKPSKAKSPEKIDGIAALVDALFVLIRARDEEPEPGFYGGPESEDEI